MSTIDVKAPPADATKVANAMPPLLQSEHHGLCPGCGHPIGIRIVLEMIEELGITDRTICVAGHGCYATFAATMDLETILTLHGRAPATATAPPPSSWTSSAPRIATRTSLLCPQHPAPGPRNRFLLLSGQAPE